MALFGTVQSYDEGKGIGSIKPETGGDALHFEKSAVNWGEVKMPRTQRRLSYELGKNEAGAACAVNLRPA